MDANQKRELLLGRVVGRAKPQAPGETHLPHTPLGSHTRCRGCGYDLYGGTHSLWRCPECGKVKPWLSRGHPKPMRPESARLILAVLGVVALAAAVLIVMSLGSTPSGTEGPTGSRWPLLPFSGSAY
jgi:hypothetical protein